MVPKSDSGPLHLQLHTMNISVFHRIAALAFAFIASFTSTSTARAELSVATLHPLMTDVAKNIGGKHVRVVGLMSPGEDIHTFNPSSKDMAVARGSDIVIASGKALETYLPKLKKSLPNSTRLVEAGSFVPSVKIEASSSLFVCCPQHAVGSIDPHWWHSVSGMKRAAKRLAKEFGKADPANAKAYAANASAYGSRLDALKTWAKKEISRVPRSDRTLVTAHAAFAYFCKEFGFKSLPVAGLSHGETSSKYLAEAIAEIKKAKVRAVFPEKNANPKTLQVITSATGASLGKALIADGSVAGVTTYEAFVRHNVNAIVAALAK